MPLMWSVSMLKDVGHGQCVWAAIPSGRHTSRATPAFPSSTVRTTAVGEPIQRFGGRRYYWHTLYQISARLFSPTIAPDRQCHSRIPPRPMLGAGPVRKSHLARQVQVTRPCDHVAARQIRISRTHLGRSPVSDIRIGLEFLRWKCRWCPRRCRSLLLIVVERLVATRRGRRGSRACA